MEAVTMDPTTWTDEDDVSAQQTVAPALEHNKNKIVSAIIVTVLFIMTFVTICGNVIVLLAFAIEKKLRNTFNYFIANLAVTDLTVAVLPMMCYTFDTALGYWPFGAFMCGVWLFFDFIMVFASCWTLVAISFDRYWAVMWSISYRHYNNKTKVLLILIPIWVLLVIIWLPPLVIDRIRWSEPRVCWWDPSKNEKTIIFVALVGHHIPCSLIIICYIGVFVITKKRLKVRPGEKAKVKARSGEENHSEFSTVSTGVRVNVIDRCRKGQDEELGSTDHSVTPQGTSSGTTTTTAHRNNHTEENSSSREMKIFVTLSYILVTYVICWVPFHIIFDLAYARPDLIHPKLYTVGYWMTYANSTLNPIIYAYSNREFRAAFKRVITCQWK